MASENHEVVDISSDEEEEDYLNWLNKDIADVVSEVVKGDSHLSIQSLEDDDDDDCVILDCDPDKKIAAVKPDHDDGDDEDEVLVVGQKGEIACRDFPHPRHACAKYSFNTTSHESYCHMCHCYVCDIPAPCPYWCTDHCHANDKDKTWKNQREFFRTGNIPTLPPAQSVIRLSSQTPSPRNKVEIRPCSSSNRVANLSNLRGENRARQRTHGLQSLRNVSSNAIRKDTSAYMGNLRSGTRYGNNVKLWGLCTNAKASRSTLYNASPTTNQEMYTQQQQQRNCAAVTGSQSNVYPQHSGHANADLFPPLTECGSQAETVEQQQPRTNENVLQTELSEVESWLLDGCNQAGLVSSPLPEPVSQDNVTFDFETFLNDLKHF